MKVTINAHMLVYTPLSVKTWE